MKRRVVLVGILFFSALVISGCLGSGSGNNSGPTLTLNPNSTTPLAAQLELSTEFESTITVTLTDGTETQVLSFDDPGTEHTLPLLGFKPDRTYDILVQGIDVTSNFPQLNKKMTLTTDPLPDDFPKIVLESSIPAKMEPGLTLFAVKRTANYIIIVDDLGEVVWYYTPPEGERGAGDVRQLPNGNLLFLPNGQVKEMDLLGNVIKRYKATAPGDDPAPGIIPVDDPGYRFHHEVYPTSWGTYLTLGFEVDTVQHFHTSESDPSVFDTVEVTDDVVIEFDEDGVVQNRWPFLDMLDLSRIGYDSLNNHYILGTGNDWVHANAVIPDPTDDSLIVSLRHQDAVVKFSRTTGELIWILGNHNNWAASFQGYLLEPVGSGFQWPYHQHAPMITSTGNLILFDNGTYRASPYDGTTPQDDLFPADNYSRAVEYRIDELNQTVEQVWEYGASITPRLYSFFLSDTDHLAATDNVWITFGGMLGVGDQSSSDMGRGDYQARLIEISRDTVNEVVYDLSVYGDAATAPIGYTVYRSERIQGFYP